MLLYDIGIYNFERNYFSDDRLKDSYRRRRLDLQHGVDRYQGHAVNHIPHLLRSYTEEIVPGRSCGDHEF
jgi:hypothetical protein